MFVHYNKSVAEFKSASKDGVSFEQLYTNHIVFIKGGENGTGEAVYTHGQYYANVKDALAALQTKVDGMKYFSKIKVGETVANAPIADGTITFSAEDPSVVTIDVDAQGIKIGLDEDFVKAVNEGLPAGIAAAKKAGEDAAAAVDAKLGAKDADAATGADATAFGRIKNLEDVVADLTGTGEGEEVLSVGAQIAKAINALDVDAKAGDFVASISQADGKIEATMGTFNFDEAGSAAQALKDAKDYADGKFQVAGNYEAEGAAAQALKDAKDYADGLADNYDAAGSANQALQDAKGYADSLAKNYDATGSAAKALEDAKAYVDDKVNGESGLEARVAANETAIGVLNGEGAGSVKKSVADAIAGVVADAPEDFDTLKEVADWIASDTTGAAKMQIDIATLKGADTVEGSVAKTVKDAVAAEAAIARAAEKANADAITVLNGTGEGSVSKAVSDAKDAIDAYTINGKAINSNAILTAEDINVAEGKTIAQAISTLESAVGEGGSVNTQIEAKIQGLDAVVTSTDGSYVTVKVTEVDGVITAVNVTESDIASASGLQNVVESLTEEGAVGAKIKAIEDDYLKAADKTELEGKINTKVAQSDYDTKIAALEAKDAELEGFWAWEEL
jgi:hypothetical protein